MCGFKYRELLYVEYERFEIAWLRVHVIYVAADLCRDIVGERVAEHELWVEESRVSLQREQPGADVECDVREALFERTVEGSCEFYGELVDECVHFK